MLKTLLRLRHIVLIGLIPLILIVIVAVLWIFCASKPQADGHAQIKGLASGVKTYRDAYGVPHIFAQNRADALRALGYVHASERFFQMDMQRRAGQGRLSEAVGPSLLGVDKFIRTLDLYRLAQSSYEAMPPETQKLFIAYSEGVNAWLDAHRTTLAPEFFLLGVNPEPWKPADSVVWGKLMALELSHNYRLEILRAELADKISPSQMQTLFPAWGNAPVTTNPKTTKRSEASLSDDPMKQLSDITSLDHAASNEWVISGSRTQSGKPILANDPHLGLDAPVLWFLARIVTPDWSVKGATVPGLPVILLGQNTNIAWGMTTTNSDVQDLFIETIDPKNPNNYLTPDGSVPFGLRKEQINIKGHEPAVITIRTTRHGAVLSDIEKDAATVAGDGKVAAFAFTGLGDKDRTSEALLNVNKAHNWSEFLESFRIYQGPPQNIVFADIKGDIGFLNPGLVPLRKKGDGMVPVDGASGAYDWKGTVPFDQWPRLYNPASGYAFNANNAVVGSDSKVWLGADWEEPFRAERLQQFFDTIDQHTLDSSARMQGDHISLAARQLLPYLLRLDFENPEDDASRLAGEALDLLRGWDGAMDKNRAEPLIFEAWMAQMHKELFVAQAKQPLIERGPFAANSMLLALGSKNNGWCDDQTCPAITRQAFLDSLQWIVKRQGTDMSKWRWGQEHTVLLKNKVFSHIPYFSYISDLSMPSNGDFYTLDRGGNFDAPEDKPFARLHGGGYRAIYDLANPDRSRFMIATGESGHILSPH